MVTLTFPEEITVTAAEAKKCRRAWEEKLQARYGEACHIWRLEAHPEMSKRLGRMHPHFHLLSWGAWFDLAWVSESWTEAVWQTLKLDKGMMDVKRKHLAAGTNCERVKKWAGVVYCAKAYIAKEEEYPVGKAGRIWGWFNKEGLPFAPEVEIELSPRQVSTVIRNVREWMRKRNIESEYLVQSFFCENPTLLMAELMNEGTYYAFPPSYE